MAQIELEGINFMELVKKEEMTRQWHYEEIAKKAIKALEKHQFVGVYAKDKEEARSKILELVPPSATVGITSSVSLRQLGISEALEGRGNIVYDHWKKAFSMDETMKIYKDALLADVFITGTNALSLTGELINIDGAGNRTSAMHFGPKKVIVVAGINKLVDNVEAGISRTKNIATPRITKVLKIPVPCAETGFCVDCDSPARACRILLILERKPLMTEMVVIIVGEELGY